MLSQSKSTLHQTKDNDPITAGSIYFRFEFSRIPEGPAAKNLSKNNTYTGIFGRNMLERMNTYMYMFDEVTNDKAAIACDKNGNDIQYTCLIIFRGSQGNRSIEKTFSDLANFHEFLTAHHLLPNKDDSNNKYSYTDNDGKEVVDIFANHEQYKQYLATHVAHPMLAHR